MNLTASAGKQAVSGSVDFQSGRRVGLPDGDAGDLPQVHRGIQSQGVPGDPNRSQVSPWPGGRRLSQSPTLQVSEFYHIIYL